MMVEIDPQAVATGDAIIAALNSALSLQAHDSRNISSLGDHTGVVYNSLCDAFAVVVETIMGYPGGGNKAIGNAAIDAIEDFRLEQNPTLGVIERLTAERNG